MTQQVNLEMFSILLSSSYQIKNCIIKPKGPFTQATFVAATRCNFCHAQNRTCKPGAIFTAICRRDIVGVSNMFETWCNFGTTKFASSCRNKNCLCKRALIEPKHQIHSVIPLAKYTCIWQKKQINKQTVESWHIAVNTYCSLDKPYHCKAWIFSNYASHNKWTTFLYKKNLWVNF